MPFVPAPNIVQVEIRATKAGIPIENRIHVDVLHTPTPADLGSIETAVATAVNADWPALLPTDVTITELVQRSLQTQNDISRTLQFGGPLVGTAGGEPLPNECTICAKLTSLFTGRSARGRLYWLGLTIDQVTTNHVSALVLNDIQDALRNIRNALTAVGFRWVVVSYINNGAPRPGGPVYFQVQDAVFVDDVVDSQRGRMH